MELCEGYNNSQGIVTILPESEYQAKLKPVAATIVTSLFDEIYRLRRELDVLKVELNTERINNRMRTDWIDAQMTAFNQGPAQDDEHAKHHNEA